MDFPFTWAKIKCHQKNHQKVSDAVHYDWIVPDGSVALATVSVKSHLRQEEISPESHQLEMLSSWQASPDSWFREHERHSGTSFGWQQQGEIIDKPSKLMTGFGSAGHVKMVVFLGPATYGRREKARKQPFSADTSRNRYFRPLGLYHWSWWPEGRWKAQRTLVITMSIKNLSPFTSTNSLNFAKKFHPKNTDGARWKIGHKR